MNEYLWQRWGLCIRRCSRRPSALWQCFRLPVRITLSIDVWVRLFGTRFRCQFFIFHTYFWLFLCFKFCLCSASQKKKKTFKFTCIRPIMPHESMRDATFTVLLHMSYCGFWAPITPAITGPWLRPMRKRKRWKLSRLIWSSTDIKAVANSTTTVTLCSSMRRSSCMCAQCNPAFSRQQSQRQYKSNRNMRGKYVENVKQWFEVFFVWYICRLTAWKRLSDQIYWRRHSAHTHTKQSNSTRYFCSLVGSQNSMHHSFSYLFIHFC